MRETYYHVSDRITGRVPKGLKRSGQWPTIRKKFLKKNSSCELCLGKTKLQVHHIIPFNIRPDLELVEENLITLCTRKKYGVNCHLLVGHLGNYRSMNINCLEDVLVWREKLLNRSKYALGNDKQYFNFFT